MAKSPTPSTFTLTRPKFGQDFLKEAYRELKRVNWPTRKETIRLTVVVLLVSVLVSAYIGALDFGFTTLMSTIITR